MNKLRKLLLEFEENEDHSTLTELLKTIIKKLEDIEDELSNQDVEIEKVKRSL
ncbi:MAG: hypothetical protein QXI54_07790 [Archaeoglobaceae archaeon]